MPGMSFDPVTNLETRTGGQENIDDYNVGREAIQGRVDFATIACDFHFKAFSGEDASTDSLGVRAVIGQKNARGQFFFFFGSLTFFCFLTGSRVPLATIGAV